MTLIIMDAGGILFDWPKATVIKNTNEILKKHNFSNIQKANKLWKKFFHYALTGKMTFFEAREKWGKKLGLNKKFIKELIQNDKRLFRKFTTPKRGIKTVLYKLKKDYKIAILSNSVNTSKEMSRILSTSGIEIKCFDKIVTSHDIGYKKPHPKAYKTVLNYFRSKPQDTIFIGHSEKEIDGAKRIGMKTISLGKNKYAEISIKKVSDIFDAIKTLENKM